MTDAAIDATTPLPQDHEHAREHLAREMRAYGRESALACLVLAFLGCAALMVLLLAGFRVQISPRTDKPVTFQVVSDATSARVRSASQPTDLTFPLVVAAAAALGASMVVFGGAMLHLPKLPSASAWTLGLSALASLLGLGFLLLALWPA